MRSLKCPITLFSEKLLFEIPIFVFKFSFSQHFHWRLESCVVFVCKISFTEIDFKDCDLKTE